MKNTEQIQFISCDINGSESSHTFNEKNKIFKNVDGVAEKIFEVEFNEAFIVASSNDTEAKKSIEYLEKLLRIMELLALVHFLIKRSFEKLYILQ